jgi:hypothetical protein
MAESPPRRPPATPAPDRATVGLLSLAGFLLVLALLAWQLGTSSTAAPPRPVLVRRIYRTTVDERVIGAARPGSSSSTSVSQSPGGETASAPPATRTS